MRSWTINRYFVGLQPGQALAVEHDRVEHLRLCAVSAAKRIEVTPLQGGQFLVRTAVEGPNYMLVECDAHELGDAVRLVLADARMN